MAYRREKWKEHGSILFQIILSFALLTSVHGSCGPLPKLVYAAPILSVEMSDKTTFSDGEQVKYTCRPGYSRNSSRVTLTCRDNSWYPTTPFCVKKRCHHPGELNNGKVFIKTDLEFGSKIEFSCLDGYNLIGSSTSTCEIFETGVTWSDPIPQCEIIICPPPPHISNGKHSNREDAVYSFGSSVTYRCNLPFSLIGEASISCIVVNGTGTWSPQPPTCKKVMCKQPQFPNGKLTSGFGPIYTYRDTVMLECNRGYIINGSNMIHCGADNQWHPDIPTCEINACTKEPVIANAEFRSYYKFDNVFPVGTVLTVTCKNGYKATSDTSLTATCQEDFSWQIKGGFCERICCPSPVINNGKILQFINDCRYVPMRPIKIQCEDYQQESICQPDGTWKPEITTCEYKKKPVCSSPKTIANGDFTIIEEFLGVSVNYFCNDGYVLIGKSTNTCRFSKWSDPFPHCQALCPKPEVSNGKLFSEKFQYLSGEKVSVQCSPGYHLLGSQNITCSENRSWIPAVPKCEWEFPEGCEKVSVGYKLMQCLPNPQDVKLALEIQKLSLEIELLKQAIGKNKMDSNQESSPKSCTHKIEKDPQNYPYY